MTTTSPVQSLAKARLEYSGRRADILARLQEIPALQRAISDLRSIVLAHRQAIVDEEDRVGPKLLGIAGRLESYLEAVQRLGQQITSQDQKLSTLDAQRSMGQIVEGFILLGVIGGLIGVNLTLGHIATAEADKEKAKVQLAQTIADLKARGADSATIEALGGVYDGLGGTIAQTGETLLKLAVVGAIGFVGYHLLFAKHHA